MSASPIGDERTPLLQERPPSPPPRSLSPALTQIEILKGQSERFRTELPPGRYAIMMAVETLRATDVREHYYTYTALKVYRNFFKTPKLKMNTYTLHRTVLDFRDGEVLSEADSVLYDILSDEIMEKFGEASQASLGRVDCRRALQLARLVKEIFPNGIRIPQNEEIIRARVYMIGEYGKGRGVQVECLKTSFDPDDGERIRIVGEQENVDVFSQIATVSTDDRSGTWQEAERGGGRDGPLQKLNLFTNVAEGSFAASLETMRGD